MRRSLILAAALVPLLAACGDNRPNTPSETSPAVTEPAPGVPEDAAGEAATTTPPGTAPAPSPGEQGGTDSWRAVAADGDATRLTRLDDAWREALSEARAGGFGKDLQALGALVDPNAGQTGRLQPPPGEYRCRTFKLGRMGEARGEAGTGYLAYPAFRCLVELTPGGDLILSKMTGSQRTRGLIYPDSDRRLVYLGAQAWGAGETGFPAYGEQPQRDQIGVVERIGDNRWRLVLPWPKQESKLDILELTR